MEIGVAEKQVQHAEVSKFPLSFGSRFWGLVLGQKPATPNVTSGVATWLVGWRPGSLRCRGG